jgi:spermidine/putrescine transport system substrate-binding protein
MIIIRALFIIFSVLLISCKEKPVKGSSVKTDKGGKEVIFYNWKDYTSKDVLKRFEERTGIKVTLIEFETLDEQLSKLQSNPNFCDVTVFDSHMAATQHLDLRIIKKLDEAKLTNIEKFTDHFKPFSSVSVPYAYGITGFAVNRKFIKEEFNDYSFLSDPKYVDKIAILDDSFDSFLALLNAAGVDINTNFSEKDIKVLDEFCEKVVANKPVFNETFTNLDLLVEGKKWIGQTYSGDASSYTAEHDFIEFIIPKNAFNSWSESLCISFNAANEERSFLTKKLRVIRLSICRRASVKKAYTT